MPEIVVENERDAIALLKRALEDQLGHDANVVFKDWPKIQITLNGEGYNSTITPSLMEGLLKVQQGVNRTYANLVLDQPDARHLKEAERKELEFKAKVMQGSSVIEVDLSEFAQKLVTDLAAKQTPQNRIVYGIVGASLWAANSMSKAYVKAQARISTTDVEADQLVPVTEEEKEAVDVFAAAVARDRRFAVVVEDAQSATVTLLRGISDAATINLNGVVLRNEDARHVVAVRRSEAEEQQLNGNYRILNVDTSKDDEIKIKVRYENDGREFWASFQDNSLDKEHVKALQTAEWSKGKVYLSVNARILRGEVTVAKILSATQQPLNEE